MTHPIIRTAVVVLLATVAGTAPAAAQEKMREARAACGADAKRFCDGIRPGGGRLMQCLKANEPALSAGCRAFLQSRGEQK
ncbi:hypothetical protein STAQ_28710 [Allostella sp. ATCC 35155]|nr:hypothetical protein STAQ_28710 [Stella sp. ATCC 35155]